MKGKAQIEGKATHLEDDATSIWQKAASWLLKINCTLCRFNLIFFWYRHWRRGYFVTLQQTLKDWTRHNLEFCNSRKNVFFSNTAQSTMEAWRLCDWSALAALKASQKNCWMMMISLRQPKSKILPERIICTEQAYLKKKRTSFVLTDCSFQSNFRRGGTQGGKWLNINLIISQCHRSFIDTWGIKNGRGAEMEVAMEQKYVRWKHEWVRWYQERAANKPITYILERWQPARFFSLLNIMHLQNLKRACGQHIYTAIF